MSEKSEFPTLRFHRVSYTAFSLLLLYRVFIASSTRCSEILYVFQKHTKNCKKEHCSGASRSHQCCFSLADFSVRGDQHSFYSSLFGLNCVILCENACKITVFGLILYKSVDLVDPVDPLKKTLPGRPACSVFTEVKYEPLLRSTRYSVVRSVQTLEWDVL